MSSNPADWMDVCLFWLCGIFWGCCFGLITRPEVSCWAWCVWVWSWILDNEETLTHCGLLAMERKGTENPVGCIRGVSILGVGCVTDNTEICYRILSIPPPLPPSNAETVPWLAITSDPFHFFHIPIIWGCNNDLPQPLHKTHYRTNAACSIYCEVTSLSHKLTVSILIVSVHLL